MWESEIQTQSIMTFIHLHIHTHHKKKMDNVHSILLLTVKYLAAKNYLIKNPSYTNYIHNHTSEHHTKKQTQKPGYSHLL